MLRTPIPSIVRVTSACQSPKQWLTDDTGVAEFSSEPDLVGSGEPHPAGKASPRSN